MIFFLVFALALAPWVFAEKSVSWEFAEEGVPMEACAALRLTPALGTPEIVREDAIEGAGVVDRDRRVLELGAGLSSLGVPSLEVPDLVRDSGVGESAIRMEGACDLRPGRGVAVFVGDRFKRKLSSSGSESETKMPVSSRISSLDAEIFWLGLALWDGGCGS